MSTLSVPISAELESYIAERIKNGDAPNKAFVVRQALMRMREEESVARLLLSQKEARSGRVFRGDLDKLAKAID